jgi:hypothetical protein
MPNDDTTIKDAGTIIEAQRAHIAALRAMVSELLLALDGDEMTEHLQADARSLLDSAWKVAP